LVPYFMSGLGSKFRTNHDFFPIQNFEKNEVTMLFTFVWREIRRNLFLDLNIHSSTTSIVGSIGREKCLKASDNSLLWKLMI
jgi:hypothetical protein